MVLSRHDSELETPEDCLTIQLARNVTTLGMLKMIWKTWGCDQSRRRDPGNFRRLLWRA